MAKCIDLTGQCFGYWTVLRQVPNPNKNGSALWLCRCKCGTERVVKSYDLRSGHTKSCGCRWHETSRINNLRHGENCNTGGLYRVWCNMRNKRLPNGARIPVAPEWNDYFVFATFARSHGYRPGLFFSRIDQRYGWYPNNVCFKTYLQKPTRKRIKTYYPMPEPEPEAKNGRRKNGGKNVR